MLRRSLVVLGLLVFGAPIAGAQGAEAPGGEAGDAKGWRWTVEPYFLAPNMTGSSGIAGVTSDVDANSGKIFSALDFGGMLYLELRDPLWAVSLDMTYMDLGAGTTTPLGNVDLDLKQSGVMLAGYRRLATWAEAMVGLQFNGIQMAFEGSGPLGLDRSRDENWVDPYLGARLTLPRPGPWRFGLFGAVGGLGIGSDIAWQAYPQVGYRFNPLFELNGGYRALYMDYSTGSGNEEFVYKLTTHGPQVGARFHF